MTITSLSAESNLRGCDWFRDLVEHCRGAYPEIAAISRAALMDGRYAIGRYILSYKDEFAKHGISIHQAAAIVAIEIERGTRTVEYMVKLAEKYPKGDYDQSKPWGKLCRELDGTDGVKKVKVLSCPNCGKECEYLVTCLKCKTRFKP